MGSTSVPSNDAGGAKTARIQFKTPDDSAYDYDIDMTMIQELLTTVVACKYKDAGCIVNDYVRDITEHEGRCLYRTIRCPVEELCKDVVVKNLVEHINEHHSSDCASTEENFFLLPIEDLEKDIQLSSKMVTICDDIVLCRLEREGHKLRISLLGIRNTNALLDCEITLMADDVKWTNDKIKIPYSDLEFNEYEEQSALFDLEKLIRLRKEFSDITIRVECNIPGQENIAKCDKDLLQSVKCRNCGDFLSNEYYVCAGKCLHCKACYDLKEYSFQKYRRDPGRPKVCKQCEAPVSSNQNLTRLPTAINSLKEYKFACANKSRGCKQYIPLTSKHELLCHFKIFNCGLACTFSGKYTEFISHLQENHIDNIVTTNVYSVANLNSTLVYMFAFGSVFLCKIIDKSTCTIEWISSSILKHNFIIEVTFDGMERGIVLRTNCQAQELKSGFRTSSPPENFKEDTYKGIYNTIKKISSFKLYHEETLNVKKITLKVHKK